MVVYKIINLVNGKLYIGQTTKSLKERWKNHKAANSNCVLMSSAIKKYGKENFEIKVLARCDSLEEMNHRESYYIKLFNTMAPKGYNLKLGGDGKVISEITRKKMSESGKGRIVSNETRLKLSLINIGHEVSELTRQKISIGNTGKNPSLEARAKMSVSGKGRKRSKESIEKSRLGILGVPKTAECKAKISAAKRGIKRSPLAVKAGADKLKKPIICNETGKIYDSIRGAAKELGVANGTLWHALNYPNRTCKGLTYSYVKKL